MIRININRTIAFIFSLLILSSCASILNSKFQKVTIVKPEESTVLIDGVAPDMKKEKYLFERNGESKQITVVKDGYKNENLAIIQNRKSPLYILTIVPFSAALFIPPFFDNLLKSRNYVSSVNLPRELTPLPDKSKFDSQIYFSASEFNLSSDSLTTTNFILYDKYIKGDLESKKEVVGDQEEMEKLNVITPNDFLVSALNEAYSANSSKEIEIIANISSVKKQYVNSYRNQAWTTYPSFGEMLITHLGIEWTILLKGEQILNYYTNTKSGEFTISSGELSLLTAEQNSLKDAAEYGFIELVNLPQLQKVFKNADYKQVDNIENSRAENPLSENKAKDTLASLITIDKQNDKVYLVKNSKRIKVNKELGFGKFNKEVILEFIKDQPELYAFTEENFHKGFGFISSLISCYNDLQLNPRTKTDQSYYYQFGLITKKEWKKGPSAEILKEKKYITGEIYQLITVTQHYERGMPTTSTTADNFKATFSYGNAEYKSGYMMKNLKAAFQDDKEAIKYITKYRSKKIRRYSFGTLGVGIIGFSIYLVSGHEAFGLKEDATPFVAVPGVLLTNIVLLLDRSYKSELISKAINTYNSNLSKAEK